jgi:hypothetical protein
LILPGSENPIGDCIESFGKSILTWKPIFAMSTEYSEKMQATEPYAEEQQGELVNASGHRQEVDRNFSLISLCAIAVTTGNTWIAQGGSVVTALSNGGLAGCLYELYGPLSPVPRILD